MGIRKKILVLGLIVCVAGFVLAVYSERESYTTVRDLPSGVWYPILSRDPVNSSVLSSVSEPYNTTLWGFGPMPLSSYLELNIAVSGPVRVVVAFVVQQGEGSVVFNETRSQFFENVPAGGGTYQVEIRNEGASAVTIYPGSNVGAKQNVTQYRIVYRYATWGVLVASVGVVLVVVGFVTRSRKRVVKSLKR